MNSNGHVVHHQASIISPHIIDDPTRDPDRPTPPSTKQSAFLSQIPSSQSPSKSTIASTHQLTNGDNGADDAQNESEAETVVLGDHTEDDKERQTIKTERVDEGNTNGVRSVKEHFSAPSPTTNGRDGPSAPVEVNVNGAKHGPERDAKSPIPTSPSSLATSRQEKDTSPTEPNKSSPQPAHSPPLPPTRGRSSSTVESRKRKLRDDSNSKTIEPPRQKAKTEGPPKDRNQPTSPIATGVGRPHKRSQSSQSVLQSTQGRKRRELANIVLPSQERSYDSSSENSSSPRPIQTPSISTHARVKRSSHRALTSPARTMGVHKKNTDRFGATRLARESEKGDLDQVRAAYEAAPEELNQVDFAGIAPLQKAALHGFSDVVGFLIDKGCKTDCESSDRDTPLIDAVENGHLDVVKLLLGKGHVNPHHQNNKGQRALDVLDWENEDAAEIEKILKEAMVRTSNVSNHDDHNTPTEKQKRGAPSLLYNEFNTETLIEKAGEGDFVAVANLISSNIKPNIACGAAAARGGWTEVLSILLASGLKPDPDPAKHETPMLVAIGRGHLPVIKLLLGQDAFDPTRRNKEGRTYYELAEERRGPRWEQERDLLKAAYDNYRGQNRSPKRTKKDAAVQPQVRTKRKSSPRGDRSSSPRQEHKRVHLSKSVTAPKSRGRLMSGRELAKQRDAKRPRRVVDDDEDESDSEEEVRPSKKLMAKSRSYSDGEEQKPVRKSVKARPGEHEPRKTVSARSEESDEDHRRKLARKLSSRTNGDRERIGSIKPTTEAESPDERKLGKKVASKTHSVDREKSKENRRPTADASGDEVKPKRAPTSSAKSTPGPPEKASTPDTIREARRLEAEQAAETKRKAAEAEAARKAREEEAAREAAEEEQARKAAEAKRIAEEEEAARIAAEAEARRIADEQAERAAREERISKLPIALQRAARLGLNRPLHAKGEELGISPVFLPIVITPLMDIDPECENALKDQPWMMSFQAVGVLGLPELDLAFLPAPYCDWKRKPVTDKQRKWMKKKIFIDYLAQDYRFPVPGMSDFDPVKIETTIRDNKERYLSMKGVYWIPHETFLAAAKEIPKLKPLIPRLEAEKCYLVPFNEGEISPTQRALRPKKSWADVFREQAEAKKSKSTDSG